MKTALKSILFATLLSISFFACRDKDQYPIEPFIDFNQFINNNGDSAEIRLNFTDGDGDIGLRQADTVAPFTGEYYYNIYMHYMYYDANNVLHTSFYLPADTDSIAPIQYKYRVPLITPVGQDKSLNGEIWVKLQPPFPHSKIRFKIWIYDRSLHKSNVIETPDLLP